MKKNKKTRKGKKSSQFVFRVGTHVYTVDFSNVSKFIKNLRVIFRG